MTESTDGRKFCLRHLSHESKLNNCFYTMLQEQTMVDMIVSCDGVGIKAHKLVLSANSLYFKNLFASIASPCQYPVIVLKDVPLTDLKAIIEFMYKGEVIVEEKHLTSVLKSAELLNVCGLTEVCHVVRQQLAKEKSDSGPSLRKRSRINDDSDNSFLRIGLLSGKQFEIRHPKDPPLPPSKGLSTATKGHSTLQSPLKSPLPTPLVPNPICGIRSPLSLSTSACISRPVQKSNTTIGQIPLTFANAPHQTKMSDTTKKSTAKDMHIINISDRPLQQSVSKTNINNKNVVSSSIPSPPDSALSSRPSTSSAKASSSTWTPSAHTLMTLMKGPSSSTVTPIRSDLQSPPIAVTIDDDGIIEDEDNDVKPPIFEICEDVINAKSDTEIPETQMSQSKRSAAERKSVESHDDTHSVKSRSNSSPLSYPSRPSSTSSQVLPPPPLYRVVQRSTARPLRTILRPPQSHSPQSDKLKESRKLRKRSVESSRDVSTNDHTPQIECPSCGEIFNDENNWNDHIANAHKASQS